MKYLKCLQFVFYFDFKNVMFNSIVYIYNYSMYTHIYISNLHSRSGSHSKWEFLQDDSSFPNCSLVISGGTLWHNRWRARLFASVFVSSYLPSNLFAYLSPLPAHLLTGSICKSIYLFHVYVYLSIDRFIHLLCLNVDPGVHVLIG